MECMRATIEHDPYVEGCFTGYSGVLERVVLKKDRYLNPPPPQPKPVRPPAPEKPAAQPTAQSSAASPVRVTMAEHPLFAPRPSTAPSQSAALDVARALSPADAAGTSACATAEEVQATTEIEEEM
jgi:hypothetical protein